MKNNSQKIINQLEFSYGLFVILPKIIFVCDFLPSSFKLKRVILLPWQNNYSNLKVTCHSKPNKFLRTKLLNNLLLAKYLIFVAVALIN